MHTCYDAYLIYGIMDADGMLLENDWLSETFPEMGSYASSVVRGYMCDAVYGYMIGISETGQAVVGDEEKEDVKKLYDILCTYHEKKGNSKPDMGYHMVVSGEYNTEEHTEYNPDEDGYEANSDEE